MYCIEENTREIVGTFRRPHSDSAPGELCPPDPSLRPWPEQSLLNQAYTVTELLYNLSI